MTDPQPLPIPARRAALFFAVPGTLVYLGLHLGVPALERRGVPLIASWTCFAVAPHLLLTAFVLARTWREQGRSGKALAARLRLRPIERRHWPWILGALPAILVMNFALSWTIPLLAEIPALAPPPIVPELFRDPYEATGGGAAFVTFMGVPTRGNFWLLGYWLGWVAVATLGEEILWRGYLLPGQERVEGRRAWLVNGLFWDLLFHAAFWTNAISDLPMMLLIPWLTQRTRSTWTGAVIHCTMVSLAFPQLVMGVFGVEP